MKTAHKTVLVFLGAALFMLLFSLTPVDAEETPIIPRGDGLTLTVQLLQNGTYGDPVKFEPVEFYDETNNWLMGTEITDENGICILNAELSHDYPLGETVFNATYRGNESQALYPACQWMNVIIVSSTNLEVNLSETSLTYGQTVSISAYLTDDMNAAIGNANVKIIGNGQLLSILQSDQQGFVSTSVIMNNTWANLGMNTLIVSYEGNLVNYYAATNEELTLELTRISTTISTNASKYQSTHLNTTWETDVLLGADNQGLSDKSIQVFEEGEFRIQLQTNETGWANIQIAINESFSLGTHNFEIKYNGSIRYEPCSMQIELSVLGYAFLTTNLSSAIAEVNTNFSIAFSVNDIYGHPINGVRLHVIDATTFQNTTLTPVLNTADFVGNLLITPPKGIHEITVKITGNEFILNTSFILNISIWSRPKISIVDCNIMGYATPFQEVKYVLNISNYQGSNIQRNLSAIISPLDAPRNQTWLVHDVYGKEISFTAPEFEGAYSVQISYFSNELRKELSSNISTTIIVSKSIPIEVFLKSYSQSPISKAVTVEIVLIAHNGTREMNINFAYWWLTSKKQMALSIQGIVNLQLRTPTEAGVYTLSYEIPGEKGISSTVGSFQIIINPIDANLANGIGISPLVSTLTISCFILLIPLIKKHYLIG